MSENIADRVKRTVAKVGFVAGALGVAGVAGIVTEKKLNVTDAVGNVVVAATGIDQISRIRSDLERNPLWGQPIDEKAEPRPFILTPVVLENGQIVHPFARKEPVINAPTVLNFKDNEIGEGVIVYGSSTGGGGPVVVDKVYYGKWVRVQLPDDPNKPGQPQYGYIEWSHVTFTDVPGNYSGPATYPTATPTKK